MTRTLQEIIERSEAEPTDGDRIEAERNAQRAAESPALF